jgi:hypothetical protein
MRTEVLGLRAGMIMDEPGGWKALSRETDVRKYSYSPSYLSSAAFQVVFWERKSPRAL